MLTLPIGVVVMKPLPRRHAYRKCRLFTAIYGKELKSSEAFLDELCDGFGAIPKSQLSFLACQR